MITIERSNKNPIILPSSMNAWEAKGAFNGSVCEDEHGIIHIVYRALSDTQTLNGEKLQVSTVGHAISYDGIHFEQHSQLVFPTEEWEKYGCEDPRIVKVGNRYFIFYTALSKFPFAAEGIKVAVAITTDFKTIQEKHLVTPFNAKAMTLFPERIDGHLVGVLTANTDKPPAKIAIAYFDNESDIWSKDYWDGWYQYLDDHLIPLLRNSSDQVEVGATPIKTSKGWLFIYSYIINYYNPANRLFTIEASFLEQTNPQKVTGRIIEPLLFPKEEYEMLGNVPKIVFPSGALEKNGLLYIYYGAADTATCVATVQIETILKQFAKPHEISLERFIENPIIRPNPKHAWEAKATFNPGAIYCKNEFHLFYRAMSQENVSSIGYAVSSDGFHIDERLDHPIYAPVKSFEIKKNPHNNSGCEDPRVTHIDNKLYMCYTAFDGVNPPRVALTSIAEIDFLNRTWNWKEPILISPPGTDDKDACIFPRRIENKYVFLHRLKSEIWIDFVNDLTFQSGNYLYGKVLLEPRIYGWDNGRIGITAPPIEIPEGWLLLYHGITTPGEIYKIGAVLLQKEDPTKIISQTNFPIFEPAMQYEKEGQVPNVVFPCGVVLIEDELFVYYGGADTVIGVATIGIKRLLKELI